MPVRILIADDHAVVREGLRRILELQSDTEVVGEACDGRDALEKANLLRPDIIIMDISMPELNGIEATGILCASLPQVKVIILSMHNTSEFVFRATQAGAWGYIIKDSAGMEVHKAIRTVMRGRKFMGQGVEAETSLFSSGKAEQSPLSSLSRREHETLKLMVEGNTNAVISEQLKISIKSVETYRSRMMQKLGINNLPSLVVFALQHGVISLH